MIYLPRYAGFLKPSGGAPAWWPPSAIAAWQAIGAANLAASYIDKTGNGNNLTPGNAPGWNSTDGFVFSHPAILNTGLTPGNGTWSALFRVSNMIRVAGKYPGIFTTGLNNNFGIIPVSDDNRSYWINGELYYTGVGGYYTSGVFGIAGNKAYYNGTLIGTMSALGTVAGTITIGGDCFVAGDSYLDGCIQAGCFIPSILSDGDMATYSAKLAALPFDLASAQISILSPIDYTVRQVSGGVASIPISGTYTENPLHIEARLGTNSFSVITPSPAGGTFSGTLSGQSGQGNLDVEFSGAPSVTNRRHYVGVGDIFVIAGQSNAVGRGTNAQVYTNPTLKASVCKTNGAWDELSDPNLGATNGSVWPLVATSYLASRSIPCAFVPCATGASSISEWLPGGTYYNNMKARALATGAKVVLWWQGESDALSGISQAVYNSALDTLANSIYSDLGVKLMACKFQTLGVASGVSQANQDHINNAIAEAWGDNSNVLTGPDLTGLTCDSLDGFHLNSDALLASAATLWWAAMAAL